MTDNTQFKTLVNEWLNQKKPMITPSTYASFTLIAENHLIPHFGKRKIGSITEADIQNYICAVAARRKKEAERQRKRYYDSTHLGPKKS